MDKYFRTAPKEIVEEPQVEAAPVLQQTAEHKAVEVARPKTSIDQLPYGILSHIIPSRNEDQIVRANLEERSHRYEETVAGVVAVQATLGTQQRPQ